MLRIEKYANREINETELGSLPKIVLPFDLRRKSRFRTTLADGTEATLFLPRGSLLRDGDLLEAEDGLKVREECSPFQPEGGAYGGGHRHWHDETFAEDYLPANEAFIEHPR